MLLYNSRDTKYKTPFGAVATNEKITINFPVASCVSVETVHIIIRKEEKTVRYELPFSCCQNEYNVFSTAFAVADSGIYYYRFEIDTSGGIWFVGKNEDCAATRGDWLQEWQLTVYDAHTICSSWLNGGLIYHIFPDRFARVEDTIKPRFGYLKRWNQDISLADDDGVYRAKDFFGGNIKGVIKKLPYLKSLSVTAIYFSPIFESNSNHRYDTGDYMKIDPLFGTEEEFVTLIAECAKLDIGIILDGVFNHTGADSIYFNKFNHYNSLGAYQSRLSPYYNWYMFDEYPDKYACWWGCTVVPTVARNAVGFQQMIAGANGVIEKWTKLGVRGWRLDVVDELNEDFVKKIAEKAQSLGDIAVIGEVWEDASTKVSYDEKRSYLFGDELDGVMNYPFRTAIINYVKSGDAATFQRAVMTIAENYPKRVLDNCMTLLGTHDTVRAITELSDNEVPATKQHRRDFKLSREGYDVSKARLMMASVLQYVLPGVPTVYYGDEIGMQGYEDPINRRPFSPIGDVELLSHYINLGMIRSKYKESFVGDVKVMADNAVITIVRENIVAVVNPGSEDYQLNDSVLNLLSGDKTSVVKGAQAIIYEKHR